MSNETKKPSTTGLEIAVIGMSGRFPGAKNLHEFWDNISNGIESCSFFSDEELKASGVGAETLENPNFIKSIGCVLEEREYFDATFFDYTPREAEIMDPQMRIFHECAWQALEDAGYSTESYKGSIGLFTGSSNSFHWEGLSMLSGKTDQLGGFAATQLTCSNFLPTRVAYKIDLQGPSASVHTACSTSLVCIHMASRALLTGESQLALAGGTAVSYSTKTGYFFQEGMIQSSDGHCRAFDAKAMGTIGGSGVGVVVLKRLKEAIADRDHIYAVIKGSAVNNDGLRKVGYTAPSIKGQFEVIRGAMRFARIESDSISYIETHGTATPLGDPVEIEALKKAFNTDKKKICGLGSVKTNIGHLDAAAGIAGFIKTVMALKHKKIPPSLHFEKPNPKIDFENSPFYVNTSLQEWKNNGSPLRAGVSSFGIGGTNAHVILEEAPRIDSGSTPSREYRLVLFSAKTNTALDKMTENFVEYLQENPTVSLDDAAYTLQVGRGSFNFRQKLICRDVKEAIDELSNPASRKVLRFNMKVKNKKVVFMFPGIGAQYVNMGLELYRKEQDFRQEMNRCFEILRDLVKFDIKEILYPTHPGAPGQGGLPSPDIDQFEIAQLVTFIFEYSLAKLLIKWGIKPDAMIGYSFGEYVAACISGVLSLEDALALVVYRGELLREIPAGGMMSVPLYEKDIKPLLEDDLAIAIDIGPSCIVSGPEPAIDELEKQLKEKRILGVRLKTSKALHSGMMQPISKAFEDKFREESLNKPVIPYISNVTGQWITGTDVSTPVYWANHLKHTVRFHDGMKELVKEENCLFVEVGPSRDLCTMIERYIDDSTKQQAVNLVRPRQSDISDVYYLLSRIGNLWLYGASIDGVEFYSREKRNRISLPSYPFEGKRFWIQGDLFNMTPSAAVRETAIRKNPNISQWFYIPNWKRSRLQLPGSGSTQTGSSGDNPVATHWLVFLNRYGPGEGFAGQLAAEGAEVTVVKEGPDFEQISHREFIINPCNSSDYTELFRELGQLNRLPHQIAHFWGVSPTNKNPEETGIQTMARVRELGFDSLIYMVKAIENQKILHDIHLGIITTNVQEVTGDEVLVPGKALVLGVAKVIPQEYSYIICQALDIDLPAPGSSGEKNLIDQLIREFQNKSLDPVVAYRNNYRWVQEFEPVHWSTPGKIPPRVREGGVYLVTGGMGNIGFLIATNLVKILGAKVILTGRTAPPPKEQWDQWLNNHKEDDPMSRKIKKIRDLEEMGGEVLVFGADAADVEQMREVVSVAEQRFGRIDGVIHAAGDTGSIACPIKQLDNTVTDKQFRPKIYGLLTLQKLFQDKEPDFCLLTSSLSPILGGLGFAAYSASNAFMDTFVYRYNRENPGTWISVNWADWRFSEDLIQNTGFGASAAELSITPAEGMQTFERILYHCRENQVVVSSGDLHARIDQWVKLRSLREERPSKEEESVLYQPRPELENTYVKPSNKLEESLAEVLQDFLGIEKVGIQDNFFEIGATSLNLIQINRDLRIKVGKDIPIVTWFEYPTIELLANYLDSEKTGKTGDAGEIDRSSIISQGKNKLKNLRRMTHEN